MDTMMNSQKLTKAYFFGLKEGVYLVSNQGVLPMVPTFAEYVVLADKRESQWQRIRDARADQRLCSIFKSEDDFCLDVKKHYGNVVSVIKTKKGVVLDPGQAWTKGKRK